uniref:Uncharacterized protein n=1 Tax=Anolis carolinensis TaxID=28377 RepID=H9GEA4_ANOCA
MAALEKDAEERARRRKENEAFANALKDKGNDAFSKGDYEAAIEKYTEGLKKQKDMPMLYTNRAQAYIKLQKYDQAIEDCDWALRVSSCDEKCIKALFHMGKAYLAQEQYRKSRECFLKILEIDPQKEKLCKGCIDEVDAEEKRQREEQSAKEAFESGKSAAVSVSQLLEKLSAPDKTPLYYAGGMRLLTEAVQDGTEQTLFRTNNGFRRTVGITGESGEARWLTIMALSSLFARWLQLFLSFLKLSDNRARYAMNLLTKVGTFYFSYLQYLYSSLLTPKGTQGRSKYRAIGLLSHILPVSLVALEEAMKQGVVKKMIKFLKTGEEATSGYALKTLAACVRNSRQAQEQIVKSDKKCSTFLKLLRSQNDVVVGNAAFCLGKCLEVPGMATNLLDTNVVKILLKVAGREAEKTQAQENAAIALGKLCNADARQVSPQDHAEYLWAPELVEGTLSKTLRLYNKREEGGLNIQAQCREDASSPPGISSEM